MILELHIIQNFAPSNLNRNDTGAPKDCIFGGSRRARISSQCFKRAMREHFRTNFEAQNNLAERSTRLLEEITKRVAAAGQKEESEAKGVVEAAMSGLKMTIKDKEKGKTQYLIFLGREEIKAIANLCVENYEALLAIAPKTEEGMTAKQAKDAAKNSVPAEITKALQKVLDGGKAADLALFGRMLADLPEKNRDASSQVAHAISTHKTGVEFDFFTAVDDLKPEDTAGSDHLGTVEFNSACFYRYANVNVEKLRENLQGDEDLTRATVEAYIRAAVEAIPTGKQNSFATHEKPSFVLATVSDAGKCSLANAFEKAVKNEEWVEAEKGSDEKKVKREGLVLNSIEKLSNHYGRINKIYGGNAKSKVYVKTNDALTNGLGTEANSFAELIDVTVGAIFDKREA